MCYFSIGLLTHLQKLQNRAARIMGMKNNTHALEAITVLRWETLASLRDRSKAVEMHKILNDLALSALFNIFMRESNVMITSSRVPLLHRKCFFQSLKI